MVQPPRVRTRVHCGAGRRVLGRRALARLRQIERQIEALQQTPRLHPKDLCQRYGVCRRTIERWRKEKLLPEPIQFTGPLWPLASLQAAELAGKLPTPAPKP